MQAAGGKLYPTVDLLARGGAGLGDSSGLEGGLAERLMGARRLGPRALQRARREGEVRRERGGFRIRAAVARGAGREVMVPRDRGDAAARKSRARWWTPRRKLLDLAAQRYRVGAGSELDVARRADQPGDLPRQSAPARSVPRTSTALVGALVGRYPAAALAAATQLGTLPPGVPAGLPSELLERRPDVLAAEQRVAAAFNLAREAKAARLPRFSLTGSVSDLSSEFFVIKNRDNPVWSVGGTVFAPLFSGGALKAQVEVRTAEQKEAMAHYVQTALKAFGDVENALSSEFALADREQILTSAVTDSQRALELAEMRYGSGRATCVRSSSSSLTYQNSRMNLLRVQSERRVQRVNLHLALGGDFAPAA